jgi:hypothetical protein
MHGRVGPAKYLEESSICLDEVFFSRDGEPETVAILYGLAREVRAVY